MTRRAVRRDEGTRVELGAGRSRALDARALVTADGPVPTLTRRNPGRKPATRRGGGPDSPSTCRPSSVDVGRGRPRKLRASAVRITLGTEVRAEGAGASRASAAARVSASGPGQCDSLRPSAPKFGRWALPATAVVLAAIPASGVPVSIASVLRTLCATHGVDATGAQVLVDRAEADGLIQVADHDEIAWRRPTQPRGILE